MRIYDILNKKKQGDELTRDEIRTFVRAVCNGASKKSADVNSITDSTAEDSQIAAFTMAVCIRGMTANETFYLTEAMAESGDMLNLSGFGALSADKHSTGGVGDKTSLICAPVAAALGCKIAKMSGRGLGHTGGTVDKLEAIRGFSIALDEKRFMEQAERTGIVIAGQTAELAPADKKIYAVRNDTATVDSIPLIASSIMSKKLAAGAHSIVLDVKYGSGAFMKDAESAEKLAETMVGIGKRYGRNMAALLTSMDAPLGRSVGNLIEAAEAVAVLKGKSGGFYGSDIYEVSIELAANMVSLSLGLPIDSARERCAEAIENGSALEKFREWLLEQGGEADFVEKLIKEDFSSGFFRAEHCAELICEQDCAENASYACDAEAIGAAAVMLGAGREHKSDSIDYTAGIELIKKPGERIKKGETLMKLYASDERRLCEAKKRVQSAVTYLTEIPEKSSLIYKTIR